MVEIPSYSIFESVYWELQRGYHRVSSGILIFRASTCACTPGQQLIDIQVRGTKTIQIYWISGKNCFRLLYSHAHKWFLSSPSHRSDEDGHMHKNALCKRTLPCAMHFPYPTLNLFWQLAPRVQVKNASEIKNVKRIKIDRTWDSNWPPLASQSQTVSLRTAYSFCHPSSVWSAPILSMTF